MHVESIAIMQQLVLSIRQNINLYIILAAITFQKLSSVFMQRRSWWIYFGEASSILSIY